MFPISMLSIRILDPFTIQCSLIQSVNLSHIASQSFIVDFFYLKDALGTGSKKEKVGTFQLFGRPPPPLLTIFLVPRNKLTRLLLHSTYLG